MGGLVDRLMAYSVGLVLKNLRVFDEDKAASCYGKALEIKRRSHDIYLSC
jgi:hypothetical protein